MPNTRMVLTALPTPLLAAADRVDVVIEKSPETEIRVHEDGLQYVYYFGELITPLGKKKALLDVYVHMEPGFDVGRCKMIKANGSRCRNAVRPACTVCRSHGAGTLERPGGRPIIHGRHSKYLPAGLMNAYQKFLDDPDIISLRSEMALLDARMAQLLERLETCDTNAAWSKVISARSKLQRILHEDECDIGDLEEVSTMLMQAVSARDAETEIWHDVVIVIDQRRKLADTERRRIVDARRYITAEEAAALIAFVTDTVNKNVTDPLIKARIAEQFKIFARSTNVSGVQIISQDMDDGDDDDDDEEIQ